MADKKEVFRDKLGRKVKTEYRTENGTLKCVNEYYYNGNSRKSLKGLQTCYDDKGNVVAKNDFAYSDSRDRLVLTKERMYNEEKDIIRERSFDKETRKLTEEKIFKRNKKGFMFAQCKTFDENGKVKTTDIFVVIAEKLFSIEGFKESKGLRELENPFEPKNNIIANTFRRLVGKNY